MSTLRNLDTWRRTITKKKKNYQVNFVEKHTLEQHLLYVACDSDYEINGSWYLDSKCNNHMVKDKNIFRGY